MTDSQTDRNLTRIVRSVRKANEAARAAYRPFSDIGDPVARRDALPGVFALELAEAGHAAALSEDRPPAEFCHVPHRHYDDDEWERRWYERCAAAVFEAFEEYRESTRRGWFLFPVDFYLREDQTYFNNEEVRLLVRTEYDRYVGRNFDIEKSLKEMEYLDQYR